MPLNKIDSEFTLPLTYFKRDCLPPNYDYPDYAEWSAIRTAME